MFLRVWGVGKVLHFSKSAIREYITYKGLKEIFHREGYQQLSIASLDGTISPYGGFPLFSFQGHFESSEKHTNVGDAVKHHLLFSF